MVPPPPALRPFLTFSRLNAHSLAAVARVVEGDDEFRLRVAGAVSEEQVGRAGWLWLERPEGWADELAEHEAAWAEQQAEEAGERDERAATRKLAAAQAAAARAEADARARLVELDEARDDLARERGARAEAEARVAELEAQLADAVAARAEVVRNLKDTELLVVARATELKAAKARIRELEADARRAGSGDGSGAGSAARSPGVARPQADVPGVEVAAQVARAAEGAAALADALAALAQTLDGDGPGSPSQPCAPGLEVEPHDGAGTATGSGAAGAAADLDDDTVAAAADTAAAAPGAGAGADAAARRVPMRLPGGMFDDTVEAAEHLLRTPEAVLVVDGYNVTMEGWPELAAAEQRRRLVAALSDLAARTATRVELVFDGAEVEPRTVPTPSRQLVRVRFSDPGVEADDVVIDLVGRIPVLAPVVVASSDKRVREGARRGGANLLHAHQLVAVLRR